MSDEETDLAHSDEQVCIKHGSSVWCMDFDSLVPLSNKILKAISYIIMWQGGQI